MSVSVVDASQPSALIEVAYDDTLMEVFWMQALMELGELIRFAIGRAYRFQTLANGLYVLEPKSANASFLEGYVTNSVERCAYK